MRERLAAFCCGIGIGVNPKVARWKPGYCRYFQIFLWLSRVFSLANGRRGPHYGLLRRTTRVLPRRNRRFAVNGIGPFYPIIEWMLSRDGIVVASNLRVEAAKRRQATRAAAFALWVGLMMLVRGRRRRPIGMQPFVFSGVSGHFYKLPSQRADSHFSRSAH